jgi:hypothetical protein
MTTVRRVARNIRLASGRVIGAGEEVAVVGRVVNSEVLLVRIRTGNRTTFERIPEGALEPLEQTDLLGGGGA